MSDLMEKIFEKFREKYGNDAKLEDGETQVFELQGRTEEYKKNSNTCPMCDTYCSYLAYEFENGYNNAIDDFIHECDKCCGFYTGNNKNLTREDMLNIAEQLKACGENE